MEPCRPVRRGVYPRRKHHEHITATRRHVVSEVAAETTDTRRHERRTVVKHQEVTGTVGAVSRQSVSRVRAILRPGVSKDGPLHMFILQYI